MSGIKKIIDDKVTMKRNLSEIFNIGSGNPIKLAYFVSLIEKISILKQILSYCLHNLGI